MKHLIILLLIVLLSVNVTLLSGCANNAETYALIGGLGGAAIGGVAGGLTGAAVGGCIGAGGGYVIGNEEDY